MIHFSKPLHGYCTNCYSSYHSFIQSFTNAYPLDSNVGEGVVLSCKSNSECFISKFYKEKFLPIDSEIGMIDAIKIIYNGNVKGVIYFYENKSSCMLCMLKLQKFLDENQHVYIKYFYKEPYLKDKGKELNNNFKDQNLFSKKEMERRGQYDLILYKTSGRLLFYHMN